MDEHVPIEGDDLEGLTSTVTAADSPTKAANDAADLAGGRKWGVPKRTLIIIAAVAVIVVLIIIGIVIALASKPTKKPTTITINTQTLSAGTLQKLEPPAGSSSVTEQLTITPNTLFKNNVEVQGATTLDKGLLVGGDSNLNGNLSVSGLITAASLSIGSLTINTLHLSGDLNFGGHIVPTGTAPTAKTDVVSSGGSVTISGNDTAGTITIIMGNGPLTPGELAIITFHSAFGTTPKVQLTPVNAAGASIEYYVTQSPTSFAIETASAPTAGASYTYNYLVTQ